MELDKCGSDSSVPSPLLRPCGELSNDEILKLSRYVQSKKPDDSKEIQRVLKTQKDGCIEMSPFPQMSLYGETRELKMYKMTKTRGRALVINNRHGISKKTGQRGRAGSEHDYVNITNMLEKFGFIISKLSADKDWNAQDIVEAVQKETQYIDGETGASIHSSLGMFVLVLMSHGASGTICGADGRSKRLTDIYSILSSRNFPAMRGKPKLIILQACSGSKTETTDVVPRSPIAGTDNSGTDDVSSDPVPGANNQPTDVSSPTPASPQPDDSFLTMDDLLVMKPSFDDYVSWRKATGSFFIRTLVTTFYLKAGSKHLVELSDLIRDIVREETIGLEEEEEKKKNYGQIPVTVCTFTNGRKLYLSPGVNMRTTHPPSLTDPVLP